MGSNDAWDGYGGAFLYTRQPTVDPKLVPRLEKAVERMRLKYRWSDFVLTDNSCNKPSESSTVLREKFVSKILITEEQQLQEQLTRLRNSAVNSLVNEEKEAAKSIDYLEKELKDFENELLKDATQIEKTVESAVGQIKIIK
jgi:violaxanthin de-epoxidase